MKRLHDRIREIVEQRLPILTAEEPDEADIRLFVDDLDDALRGVIRNRYAEAILYDARFVLAQAYQQDQPKLDARRLREVTDRVWEILQRPAYGSLPADVERLQVMIDAMRSAGEANAAYIRSLEEQNKNLKAQLEVFTASYGR